MLRLVYSNRTEELLSELAARVRAEQREEPLQAVRVVVPNAIALAYVKLGVAKERGIAANLDVSLLTRFASSLAPDGVRVADAAAIEARVLGLLLDDEFLARPELAPVLAYLRAAGDSADAVELRRVQLALRLGRIFEEYTYSRSDMLAAWRSGVSYGNLHEETARWQRAILLSALGEEPRLVPLSDVTASLDLAAVASRPVHVFGFAHVARAYYELFARLSRVTDLSVYSLSPCEGFWEDVDRRDPAPLHLWGRPGRDHVRVLNELAGFDHDDRFVDPLEGTSPTLLRRVQADVLRRVTRQAPSEAPPQADRSVTISEHASVRREIEAVASSIWDMVEKDDSLRYDEIAVLVPPAEASKYAAHLPTVFREAHHIPHQMMGIAAPGPTSVAEAIDLLLALPLGRFSRSELLRLVVHPSLVAAFGAVDPRRWSAWCDALGIVYGADKSAHEGTYIDRDILNWDQGLRRLALGAFMVGDTGARTAAGAFGGTDPFVLGAEAYAPYEVATGELGDAAAFGLLARSLIFDAQFAREQTMTMPEWAELLGTMVSTYITPVDPDEAEELTRHLRKLRSLGEAIVPARKVGYRTAYELALRRLGSGSAGSGSEGVVVSTIAGVRAIPFRVVFACGMGEGRFPSAEAEDPLDLRWASRREGDVSSRERDKYAFLELLLGARDRLAVSYVSRDALTGDPLAPSSVVQELLHALERGYVGDASSLRLRHPLRRWDPEYRPALFGRDHSSLEPVSLPEARAEATTLALRLAMESQGQLPDAHEVRARAEANEAGWSRLAEHLRLAPMPRAPRMSEGKVTVPMHALVKFLEFPLHGWAQLRFGLGELEDDDVLATESEPFETELREETLFLRGVLLDAKRRAVPIEQAYDEAVRARELRGAGPSGAFARGERGDHMETLRTWRAELARHDVAVDSLAVHRFGRGAEHAGSEVVHDALAFEIDVLEGGTRRILSAEVTGRTLPLGSRETAVVTLAKRVDDGGDEWALATRRRTLLRALVDHAVLCAGQGGGEAERSSLIVIATPDGPRTERIRLAPWTRDGALLWLRTVVRDLLGAKHDYFFPYEAVLVQRQRGDETPLSEVLREARDKLRDGRAPLPLRSAYGPVPRPQEYRIPGEEEARAMVSRRFGPLFDGWSP